jgi:hypothetical protein
MDVERISCGLTEALLLLADPLPKIKQILKVIKGKTFLGCSVDLTGL